VNVLSVSVTRRGQTMAARLPYPSVHGGMAEVIRERWNSVDGFVLFVATGAAVRITAPLLTDKASDPGVVCVDESGQWVIALTGGHAGGANTLAAAVAWLLGAQAVITTATDSVGQAGMDTLAGFVARGDVAFATSALLDGRGVHIDNPLGWPVPWESRDTGPRVLVTDAAVSPGPGEVVLHPPSLIVGAGASTGAEPSEMAAAVATALDGAGLSRLSVAEVATLDRKANEPAIVRLGWAVRAFPSTALARVEVPRPSAVVQQAVGTPSVAEAAALLAAGPGATLVVPKRAGRTTTVAVARRAGPRGHLSVVGLGPGDARHRTPAAATAVATADVVLGYGPYVDQCAALIRSDAAVVRSPIGAEVERAAAALAAAAEGRRVALVCSGDAGVYAMASLVFELVAGDQTRFDPADIEVVPGVTAALASAALLGAPLGHDHVAISLSDLMTPWPVIEQRLEAAGAADLVVSLYNPRSSGRTWQLDTAMKILRRHREDDTPVGVVTDAGRPAGSVRVTTIGQLDPGDVGMTTLVIVGASSTRVVGGRMFTPRGYRR